MTEGTGYKRPLGAETGDKAASSCLLTIITFRGRFLITYSYKDTDRSGELGVFGLRQQQSHQPSGQQQSGHQQDGHGTVCVHQHSKGYVPHDGSDSAHSCEETQSGGPEGRRETSKHESSCLLEYSRTTINMCNNAIPLFIFFKLRFVFKS